MSRRPPEWFRPNVDEAVGDAHHESPTTGSANDDADAQLWQARRDPAEGLRGVPVIGAGPGTIKNSRPEDAIRRLARELDLDTPPWP